jgi:hypothetical protein
MRSFYRLALAAALALTFGVTSASADTQEYLLTSLNISGTGPFAEVTVDRTSSNMATITFDALSSGSTRYLFHGQGVAVTTNGSATTGGPFVGTNSIGSPFTGSPAADNSGMVAGFSTTNGAGPTVNSFAGSDTHISFTVTLSSGTWSSASSVITNAAAAVGVWDGTSSGFANTGFATGLVPVPTPEPGPLVGAGVVTLIGLGYTWLRRRRATA